MAFRLRAREAPAAGMRRIVTEQLDAAVRSLRGASPGDRHAAVYEARKACKRARAALRLARSN
ncbi:MAG: hypothetical protein H0V19_06650, partial [Euzebyales bacterium]|nr:hypothetical protein [Euzebyales bacterium]